MEKWSGVVAPGCAGNDDEEKPNRMASAETRIRFPQREAMMAGEFSFPEGNLKIARQFTAGFNVDRPQVPKGWVNRTNVIRLLPVPVFVAAILPSLRDLMPALPLTHP